MVKYIIIILVLLSFQAEGQIIRANPFYTSRGVVVVSTDTLLLDSFPNAAAAYSLRKLRSAYTGNAIRVRRSSNNNEQDIGFVDNFLDTTSLKTFCSGTNCFVTTWYDQGDSARNATNATAAQQPRIVNAGTLERKDNSVHVVFNRDLVQRLSANSLAASFAGTNKPFSAFGVPNKASTNTIGHIFNFARSGQTYGRIELLRMNNDSYLNIVFVNDAGTISQITSNPTTYSAGTRLLFSTFSTGTAQTIYKDGTSVGTATITQGANTPTTATIGGRVGNINTEFFAGGIQEIILYNTDQSSNRTAIENNINRNWLIY
jgi:hypothetical protein